MLNILSALLLHQLKTLSRAKINTVLCRQDTAFARLRLLSVLTPSLSLFVVVLGAAYRSMLKDELNDLQSQALEEFSSLPAHTLHTLLQDKRLHFAVQNDVENEGKMEEKGKFPSTNEAQALFDSQSHQISHFYTQKAEEILIGTQSNSSLNTLQTDFHCALEAGNTRAKELFVALYSNAFHEWLLSARLVGEGRVQRLFAELRSRLRESSGTSLLMIIIIIITVELVLQ